MTSVLVSWQVWPEMAPTRPTQMPLRSAQASDLPSGDQVGLVNLPFGPVTWHGPGGHRGRHPSQPVDHHP